MNYELAKELKEAGFPQSNNPCTACFNAGPGNRCSNCGFPTLSELIEACGEDFWNLGIFRHDGRFPWVASSVDPLTGSGSTPEEAVARLWLALNKKI